ncbi:MAG: hypothetical protein IJR49_04480 [Treponema sp.]|nr:hypothetical protein [Treponema sp.]
MKKIIKHKSFLAIMISLTFLFSACYQIIFSRIMGEVKLEDPIITGRVNSIVRYTSSGTEYIFVTNGSVYCKSASSTNHNDWTSCTNGLTPISYDYYNGTFKGEFVAMLAVDVNNVYALAVSGKAADSGYTDYSKVKLYRLSDIKGTWELLGGEVEISDGKIPMLFCTNTFNSSYREAFIKIGTDVYQLDASFNLSSPSGAHSKGTDGLSDNTQSVVSLNGIRHFYDSIASVSDESQHVYVANSSTISKKDSSFNTDIGSVTSTGNIISLAVTQDLLLVGTKQHGLQTYNISTLEKANAIANSDTALGQPYEIVSLLATNPALNANAQSIFAGVDFVGLPSSTGGDYKSRALWAYYKERGNWNRE